jgi:hypothetical protein
MGVKMTKKSRHVLNVWLLALSGLFAGATLAAGPASDPVLVIAVKGQATRQSDSGVQPLQAFIKLREGDVLTLSGAQVQLVYVAGQRQETWQGSGKVQVGATEGKGSGLAAPQVKQLPEVLVKQMAKMPTAEGQGRAGAIRLRSLPTPEAFEQIDQTYRQLRQGATADDLNPELYLLSSLFELKAYDRVEQAMADLRRDRPNDPQASALVGLYRKSVDSARNAAGK